MSDFDGPTAPQRASHLANQAVIDAAASRQIAQRTANRQVMAISLLCAVALLLAMLAAWMSRWVLVPPSDRDSQLIYKLDRFTGEVTAIHQTKAFKVAAPTSEGEK